MGLEYTEKRFKVDNWRMCDLLRVSENLTDCVIWSPNEFFPENEKYEKTGHLDSIIIRTVYPESSLTKLYDYFSDYEKEINGLKLKKNMTEKQEPQENKENFVSYQIRKFDNRIEYLNDAGEIHREDGPAIEYNSGTLHWYKNGVLHREDGYAVEKPQLGVFIKFINGKKHCEDGPAVTTSNSEKYYIDGKLHREDGPAWIDDNKSVYYYKGEIHREDGPAVTYFEDSEPAEYYILGTKVNELEYKYAIRALNQEKIIRALTEENIQLKELINDSFVDLDSPVNPDEKNVIANALGLTDEDIKQGKLDAITKILENS